MAVDMETEESRSHYVPTVAGRDLLTLQGLLQRAVPMLTNPETFAESERMALAATICETLMTAPDEDYETGSLSDPWE